MARDSSGLLFERGYSREQIVPVFNIIDWMIQLPRVLEPEFVQAAYAIQAEKHMPYVNTIECFEREKERQEGQLEAKQQKARNLIAWAKMEDVMIAEIAGLAVEDVARLRAEGKR